VGIDTYTYVPPKKEKSSVLIYFKTRFPAELAYCEKLLQEKSIAYNIINYDTGYQESDFLSLLEISKYVIRIGRQETQGIALEEVLSMNVPILLRDVHTVGQWEPHTEYEKK
jgi:glycosyltransferase involved in cell wall biosynthesis